MFIFSVYYSGTSQIRTSRIRLPPQYDRFFIDGFFFLLCLSKSYLPNKITSQTRYTMMKIGRNTIGHNFLSKKKSYLRVNYRQIDHDGVDLLDYRRLWVFVRWRTSAEVVRCGECVDRFISDKHQNPA